MSVKLPIDINDIIKLIPHRYPFLLIDRITEMELGHSATAIKNVTINENFFQGHFPERPVMPGVLIIEALAQTAATLVMSGEPAESAGSIVYFMSIENAKFRKPVVPGDQLQLTVKVLKNRRNVWKMEGTGTVDGVTVTNAQFSAMIVKE